MTDTPLHWQTISALSHRIHNGSLSPVELMEHLLARVEALDSRLHICTKGFDEATALRVGYAYEQATAWHLQTPDLSWAGEVRPFMLRQ